MYTQRNPRAALVVKSIKKDYSFCVGLGYLVMALACLFLVVHLLAMIPMAEQAAQYETKLARQAAYYEARLANQTVHHETNVEALGMRVCPSCPVCLQCPACICQCPGCWFV